jgi:hypothetical protein
VSFLEKWVINLQLSFGNGTVFFLEKWVINSQLSFENRSNLAGQV